LNRLQNQNDLLLADARSGEVRRVFRDESKTWVDVVDGVEWIDKGGAFLWLSERDGWRHVYRVPRGGGEPLLVTRFDADVIDLVGPDEQGAWVYFTASPEKATEQSLYRSRLDGAGAPERVTPRDQPGTHGYVLAPGARLAFHTWSRFDVPPATEVVDLPGHASRRALTDITTLRQKVAPLVQPGVEFFTVSIDDGVTLDGWMLKPSQFDLGATPSSCSYSGGGQPDSGRSVGRRAHALPPRLAEAGYIVLSVDNRGTPAPKGRHAWRKARCGAVGDLSSRNRRRPSAR
jgi:dipeptidyl-peptidase-4